MSQPNGRRRYQVSCSEAVIQSVLSLQLHASQHGKGDAVRRAFRQIIEQLELDPHHAGEALYRLEKLSLQVRARWSDQSVLASQYTTTDRSCLSEALNCWPISHRIMLDAQ
jgi:hypothetical protein